MFNTPILDVAIGLVFVFLIYSLLATSIKEAIASALGLRARMLKKGIIESMLSNTPSYGRWESIIKGIYNFLVGIFNAIIYKPAKKEEEKKLGDKFYDHPLLKNYGSNRIFPHPSYLPSDNFSVVLLDILKEDFKDKMEDIAQYKCDKQPGIQSAGEIQKNLENSSDANKIKELLEYYMNEKVVLKNPIIDKDTCKILQMHLRNSVYSIEEFSKKLETWFDDTMNRVSGWYKRQAQIILFFIGITMAITFNIDTVEITTKLSHDKNLSDQIVKMATSKVELYKNDTTKEDKQNAGKSLDTLQQQYKREAENLSSLLALGWNDYGKSDTSFINNLKNKIWVFPIFPIKRKFICLNDSFYSISQTIQNSDSIEINNHKIKVTHLNRDSIAKVKFYEQQSESYPVRLKTAYIWYALVNQKKKLIGFLITAFSICLGAPFWFDMLNKLIKLRGTGKKESGDDESKNASMSSTQPVAVNVNTQTTQEAVG